MGVAQLARPGRPVVTARAFDKATVELSEVLERCLHRKGSVPPSPQPTTPRDVQAEPPASGITDGILPVFDASVLKRSLPQGAKLDSELTCNILTLFASDARRLVTEIERACGAADCDTAFQAAHTLKSSGSLVGAVAICTRARKLEAQARAGNAASLPGYSAVLQRELERFLVNRRVQRLTAQPGTAAA